MTVTTQAGTLTDLDILHTFEASAAAAVLTYAGAMTKVNDPALRKELRDLLDNAFHTQQAARDLLLKWGATA